MVTIKVKLFATLRRYRPDLRPGEALKLQLEDGATLRNLLDKLGIPHSEPRLFFVNGIQREPDYILQPGDEVGIFPPIAGGNGTIAEPAFRHVQALPRGEGCDIIPQVSARSPGP